MVTELGRLGDPAPGQAADGFRVLLVHVEADKAGEERVQLAARLANQLGGHLIGTAAGALRTYYAAEDVGFSLTYLLETDQANLIRDLKAAEEVFQRVTSEHGVTGEWHSIIGFPREVFLEAARSTDLLVFGSPGPGARDNCRRVDIGDVVMEAGRPILVVPRGIASLQPRRVVVAWKDTREARRAVADAIGILRHAGEITLCSICGEEDRAAAKGSLEAVRGYLGRHDIEAQILVRTGNAETELLDLAQHCDLIVAGAYGHSRVREWVFGGVTRALLDASPACTFLSR